MAFPEDEDAPASAAKAAKIREVSPSVSQSFLLPVLCVIVGSDLAVAAGVKVPEATVNVDDFVQTGQDDIGVAG